MQTMIDKIKVLTYELNHASDEYYNKNNSIMSDEEWDEKLEDVIYTYGLENKYDDTSYLIDKNENIEHIYILNK